MAQQTVKLYWTKWAYVKKDSPSVVVDITGSTAALLERDAVNGSKTIVYVGFDAFPNLLKRKRLYEVSAVFSMEKYRNSTAAFLCPSSSDFDPTTLVWTNRPPQEGNMQLISQTILFTSQADNTFSTYGDYVTDEAKSGIAHSFVKHSAGFFYSAYNSGSTIGESRDSYVFKRLTNDGLPYIEISYDDSIDVKSKVSITSAPTSGYVNPREASSFRWTYIKDDTYSCADEAFEQASAVFYWKYSTDENYNSIAIQNSQTSLTIPANTFDTAKTVQWYIEGTDDAGTVSQTAVYSFSTAAGAVTATALAPSNTIQSNNQPITFQWSYSSPDGFAPTRYKFMWKLVTDAEYTTLVDSTDVVDTYTFPAYTFPAGEIQWVVVPYNIDSVQGSGTSTTFICYGAPETPVVYAPAVPFTTISWQAADQQGYEIQIDGTAFGPYFGTEKSFALPDFLPDGNHDVRVRVIGSYGLWSEWGSTSVPIENTPGEDIELSGEPSVEPVLTWTTEEATSDFLIYRDGVQIGHTAGTEFRDRYAAGEHTYKVINRLASGNYSESNALQLLWEPDAVYIAQLRSGEWIRITCSEQGEKDPSFEETSENSFNHLSGDVYPSAALSGYKTGSLSWSAIFLQEQSEERRMFESLLGKAVIMKTRDGSVYVGVMGSVTKKPYKLYYMTYSFTLQRIEWEDYTDDTQ